MCVLYKHSCDLLDTKPGNNSFKGLSLDHSQWNALVSATPMYKWHNKIFICLLTCHSKWKYLYWTMQNKEIGIRSQHREISSLLPSPGFLQVKIHAAFVHRVSQKECARLRESIPYVKVYQYNPKHLYPKLNGYGDNGQRSLKLWQLLHTYWLPNTY